MKRKIILSLLALSCASTLALGLAACGGSGGSSNGGNSGSTPPNYTPPNDEDTELFTFELNDEENGYIVTGLAEGVTDASITIPSVYNSLPVTTIGERAFGDCLSLTNVTISPGVSIIGSGAFTGCINLPSFKFPASITQISDSAFQNCTGLRAVHFNGTSQLEEISANAFQNCSKLSSIDIPDSVVTVGDRVFQNCSSLKSVTIGDGVETIGVETFRGCEVLESVTIGNSLKYVAERAFLDCSNIAELHFPDSLESVGLGALEGCTGIEKLTIPFVGKEKYDEPVPEGDEYSNDNHTNFGYIFGAGSFHDNSKLTLDNLDTVTITGDSPIGYHAFQGIGRFADASETSGVGLNKIIITGNVKIIGTGAFQGCFNLQTLVLPNSLTQVGAQLLDIGIIKYVYFYGTETEWDGIPGISQANNPGLYGTTSPQYDARYFYSESEPSTDGQYWRYVDGVPTPWNK